MEYTKLGRTEIEISRVCVGCMSFGKAGTVHDWTLDESATEAVIRHALDLGINFFDTANGYSARTSEEYLGKALRKSIARDKVVIASKVYFNPGRLSREAITGKSTAASGVWVRITSICTSSTAPITKRPSRRPWKR